MERLKQLRQQKHYTQVKMQFLTGIDQSAYSKMERGYIEPSLQQCKRLAMVLGTSIDYLAELTDNPTPYPRAGEYKKRLV